MSMQMIEEDGGKLLDVRVSGKLNQDDYSQFVP
jgi:hypothetical protein